MLEYVTEGGYQYRQSAKRSARVVRVPLVLDAVSIGRPKVGDTVRVIVKPYFEHKYVTGIVKRVLTKKAMHTRGFKVMLMDGTVGRMVTL
jgi:uncharacterized repeat protein (TIGR03833 family)